MGAVMAVVLLVVGSTGGVGTGVEGGGGEALSGWKVGKSE